MTCPAIRCARASLRVVALLLTFALPAIAQLTPVDLRCDGMIEPLGIDSTPPRLSWKLEGEGRGLRQTAWQIMAATAANLLERNEPDLWDSGRVESSDQLHRPYAGHPLATGQQVYWKVCVWDGEGRRSAWSPIASWTMGVVGDEPWPAKWITSQESLQAERRHLGYSSQPSDDPHTTKWVQLDLGAVYPVHQVKLHAVTHTVPERLGFPRWFRLELAEREDFSDARVLADHTQEPTNPWLRTLSIDAQSARGRYLRLVATQLRRMREDDLSTAADLRAEGERGRLALSQIEVLSEGRNVARHAQVTASDSLETDLWSTEAVVDGRGIPGANPRANETLRLRREFTVRPGLRRALLFVCGLGHHTLQLNGNDVGDAVLATGWTEYDKTCLYDTHDLTGRIVEGENALGLTLAGGMFSVPPPGEGRYTKFVGRERPLMAIAMLRLEYSDGRVETLATDETWRTSSGPITYAHVYGGIDYDARLDAPGWGAPGFEDRAWRPAAEVDGPGGELRGASSAAPPIRPQETLRPIRNTTLRPGVDVYDLGQNAALTLRLRVRGAAGSTIKVIPAELVREDGSVDRSSVGGSESSWRYTLAGRPDGERWEPRLFYHGARYLQVERTAPGGAELPSVELLEGVVVHSDSQPVGHFATSSELFNRIRELVRWAQRSNASHVLTDCPHRERLSWLEQYHLNGPSLRYEYDLSRLFAKTFNDMADAQRWDGLIPSTAPEYVIFDGGFRDSPEWGSALVLAAWQQFVWTADDAPLRRHFEAMRRYADYLSSRANDGILSHGLGDWYDIGPNRPGFAQLTPVSLTATAFHYLVNETLAKIAQQLDRAEDAVRYRERAAAIGAAFNTAFFDPALHRYATGSQTAQALPLALGLVPVDQRAAVVDTLIRDIRSRGNALTAGDVGYRYLLRALADARRSDVVYDMNHQVEKPGYGFQLAHGATSLTEAWDAGRHSSQNHFMLGQIIEWFYRDLVGIGVDSRGPGFARIRIAPQPVDGIDWVEAEHESPRGPVRVRWERSNGSFGLSVTVPPNATATVHVPAAEDAEILESGRPAAGQPGVTFVGREASVAVYQIGSGAYAFEVHP